MEKIPTASELFNSKFKTDGGLISNEDIQEYAIEFARLHVIKALKEASEKQVITAFYEEWDKDELLLDEDDNYEGTYKGPVLAGGKVFVVDKDSILNSYKIENIK